VHDLAARVLGGSEVSTPAAAPDTVRSERLTATDAAREAIARLRDERGEAVMFVQSGGCCAGSTPMCYPLGEFLVGDVDVLIGEIDGCPFYIDTRLDSAWGTPQFVLDVAPGEPEGFSLGAGPGLRFVTTGDACAVPEPPMSA
jgi:uncharacterized protein (DUF779 family)